MDVSKHSSQKALTVTDSLRNRTIGNLAIIFSFKIFVMILSFGRSLILARLLFPEDFAIVALATSVIYLIEHLFVLGFSKVLIHKPKLTQDDLDTAFTLNLLQNSLFFVAAYFIAPLVAGFYEKDVLVDVLQLLSLEFLLQIIGFIPKVLLKKRLQFKALETIDTVCMLIGTTIVIVLAFAGYSFWSLIFASLTERLLASIAYMFVCKSDIHIRLTKKGIKEYLSFGIVIYLAALVTYVCSIMDTFIIGKISTFVILGYYTVAKQWAKYFHLNFFSHASRVLFPTFAHIQGDPHRLRAAVLETLRNAFPFIFAVQIGFMEVVPDFIMVFLGEKWEPSIIPMRILCIAILFESIGWLMDSASDALGKFYIKLRSMLVNLTILVLFFPLAGYLWGTPGYSLAIAVATFCTYATTYYLICFKTLKITFKQFTAIALPTITSSAVMVVITFSITLILNSPSALRLALIIVSGAISYLATLSLMDRDIVVKWVDIVRQQLRKIRPGAATVK